MRWLVVFLVAISAAYMVFDGVRALVVGDYLTPSSGEHTGQLGPWAILVERVGIAPRSNAMKWTFVAYGTAWLVADLAFAAGQRWAWWAVGALALGSLWYLVPGTVISMVVIGLLLLPGIRDGYTG